MIIAFFAFFTFSANSEIFVFQYFLRFSYSSISVFFLFSAISEFFVFSVILQFSRFLQFQNFSYLTFLGGLCSSIFRVLFRIFRIFVFCVIFTVSEFSAILSFPATFDLFMFPEFFLRFSKISDFSHFPDFFHSCTNTEFYFPQKIRKNL